MDDSRNSGMRVGVQERELVELMGRYPKLTRTEITDVITRTGPMRTAVEAELERISAGKR